VPLRRSLCIGFGRIFDALTAGPYVDHPRCGRGRLLFAVQVCTIGHSAYSRSSRFVPGNEMRAEYTPRVLADNAPRLRLGLNAASGNRWSFAVLGCHWPKVVRLVDVPARWKRNGQKMLLALSCGQRFANAGRRSSVHYWLAPSTAMMRKSPYLLPVVRSNSRWPPSYQALALSMLSNSTMT
jgi:hypothetical protein